MSANQVYRIEDIGAGFLAVMAHPASAGDAAAAFSALAAAGVRQVVSLLEPQEAALLGLANEAELAQANAIRFHQMPITDMGSPTSIGEFAALARRLDGEIRAGINSVIHCRAGVGRSGLLAAAVLMQDGRDAQSAFTRVARKRGMPLPETTGQGDWLALHQAQIQSAAPIDRSSSR